MSAAIPGAFPLRKDMSSCQIYLIPFLSGEHNFRSPADLLEPG